MRFHVIGKQCRQCLGDLFGGEGAGIEGQVGQPAIQRFAQRLQFGQPMVFDDRVLDVGASVGCALGLPGVVADGVVAAADAALYAAKREGRGTWRLAGAAS